MSLLFGGPSNALDDAFQAEPRPFHAAISSFEHQVAKGLRIQVFTPRIVSRRSKAKQSEAKRSKRSKCILQGDETLETLETSMHLCRVPFARFHCMSTQCRRSVSALRLSSASGASCAQTRIGSISLERSSLEWMEPRQTKAAKIQNDNELKIIKMSSWFNLDCD